MLFSEFVNKYIDKLDNIYDLAALCYDFLCETVENQSLFLGTYIMENESAEVKNPNLKGLLCFSDKIEKEINKQENNGKFLAQFIDKLQCEIIKEEKKLTPYEDDLLNKSTIAFFVLLALDRHAAAVKRQYLANEPLNNYFNEKVYVYLSCNHTILEGAAEEIGFSSLIREHTIRMQLQHLIILEKNDLERGVGIPQIVPLHIEQKDMRLKNILNSKEIKIAVIPFGEEEMLEFPVEKGSLFSVTYKEEHLLHGKEKAIFLLEKAIKQKANIIVFPEFICSKGIQEAIQEKLTEISSKYPKRLEHLLLVIAGSSWEEDDNNVSRIYSYNGELIGKQYKYCPYSDVKGNMIEKLTTPGKVTTFVSIEGFGLIGVRICKDISERAEHIRRLNKYFAPQLLLVPAWSRSVHIGFEEQLKEIVTENHRTVSVMCNCCEAIKMPNGFKKDNGIIVTPYKDGSVMRGKGEIIRRNTECNGMRCYEKGCIFMYTVAFDTDAVRNKKMIRKKRRIS